MQVDFDRSPMTGQPNCPVAWNKRLEGFGGTALPRAVNRARGGHDRWAQLVSDGNDIGLNPDRACDTGTVDRLRGQAGRTELILERARLVLLRVGEHPHLRHE